MVQSTQNVALERNVYGGLRHRGDHGKTLAKNRNIHGKIAQKDHLRVFFCEVQTKLPTCFGAQNQSFVN